MAEKTQYVLYIDSMGKGGTKISLEAKDESELESKARQELYRIRDERGIAVGFLPYYWLTGPNPNPEAFHKTVLLGSCGL